MVEQRNRDLTAEPVEAVVNFLAELYAEGYKYRSLNAYRSAISSIHEPVEGQSVGQYPLVSHLLKGAFNQNPLDQGIPISGMWGFFCSLLDNWEKIIDCL